MLGSGVPNRRLRDFNNPHLAGLLYALLRKGTPLRFPSRATITLRIKVINAYNAAFATASCSFCSNISFIF